MPNCSLCGKPGTAGVDLFQAGGHEPGSQAPNTNWYCDDLVTCFIRKVERDQMNAAIGEAVGRFQNYRCNGEREATK